MSYPHWRRGVFYPEGPTHMKRLTALDGAVDRHLERITPLAPALDVILWQLAPDLARLRDAELAPIADAGHDVYAYFNNDGLGRAPQDARRFVTLVGGRRCVPAPGKR